METDGVLILALIALVVRADSLCWPYRSLLIKDIFIEECHK